MAEEEGGNEDFTACLLVGKGGFAQWFWIRSSTLPFGPVSCSQLSGSSFKPYVSDLLSLSRADLCSSRIPIPLLFILFYFFSSSLGGQSLWILSLEAQGYNVTRQKRTGLILSSPRSPSSPTAAVPACSWCARFHMTIYNKILKGRHL